MFTSELAVNEFALLHKTGIRPLTQVMGSSIFQRGYANLPKYAWTKGTARRSQQYINYSQASTFTRELTSVSHAFNASRARALSRLRQEAELAGADAVVGVHIRAASHGWAADGTIEYTAIGTAVRLPDHLRTGETVITDLSGQEFWQLTQAGYRPVGVVADTTVVYVAAGPSQSWLSSYSNRSGAGRDNRELRDFSKGFYDAREIAMRHVSDQAKKLNADGIVGVQFVDHVREREYHDTYENPHYDLIVHIDILATAIAHDMPAASAQPRRNPIISFMTPPLRKTEPPAVVAAPPLPSPELVLPLLPL
jgi:uncharacterized protein YbjQ (UPF0145 family)